MKNVITVIAAIIFVILLKMVYDEIIVNIRVKNDVFSLSRNIHTLIYDKQYKKAISSSNSALKRYPNSVEILSARADAYRELKNYNSALDDYNLIINMKNEKKVNVADIYLNMSYIYSDMKEYRKALDILDKAIELNPHDDILYLRKGNIKYAMSDYKGTIDELNKAIVLNPYAATSYAKRADVYLKLNEDEKAKNDKIKMDEMQTLFYKIHDISMMQMSGKNNEAIQESNELLKKYPQNTELIRIIAENYEDLKDYDSALKCYEELEKFDTFDKATIYKQKAFIYNIKKDNQKALNMINKAIEYDKTNDDYLYNLRGNIKKDLKDYQGAINDFTSAIKYNPYDSQHYFNRAMVYSELGDNKNYNADMKMYNSF